MNKKNSLSRFELKLSREIFDQIHKQKKKKISQSEKGFFYIFSDWLKFCKQKNYALINVIFI
jgi:hypothetical protein